MTDPIADLELNCRTQLSLLEALRRRNPGARVVFAGSRQQYGRPRYLPVDEHHPLEPVDVNGINKAAAEAATLLYHQVHGLPTCSLRLTNTLRAADADAPSAAGLRRLVRAPRGRGAGDRALRRRGVASRLQRGRGRGRRVSPLRRPTTRRSERSSTSAIPSRSRSGSSPRLLLEVAGGGLALGAAVPGRPRRGSTSAASSRTTGRSASRLGWEPRVGLREGLTRMVDYYRAIASTTGDASGSSTLAGRTRRSARSWTRRSGGCSSSEQIVLGPEVEAFEREFAELTGTRGGRRRRLRHRRTRACAAGPRASSGARR